jgi:protein-L-isoaspartate O-methyltransferase
VSIPQLTRSRNEKRLKYAHKPASFVIRPASLRGSPVALAAVRAGLNWRPASTSAGTRTVGTRMAGMRTLCALVVVLAATLPPLATAQTPRNDLAPFVATPEDVVERMLGLAKVGPGDVVYDLGCGDGRIVIAAARKFGARGVGIDIDANLVNKAEARAKAEGVSNRVRFEVGDAMAANVSQATVVTLYLLSASNVRLRPLLTKQLRKGARIVSHSFAMGDWEPEVVDTFRDQAGTSRTLYLWTADGRVRP